jgi:hypothetical protein
MVSKLSLRSSHQDESIERDKAKTRRVLRKQRQRGCGKDSFWLLSTVCCSLFTRSAVVKRKNEDNANEVPKQTDRRRVKANGNRTSSARTSDDMESFLISRACHDRGGEEVVEDLIQHD